MRTWSLRVLLPSLRSALSALQVLAAAASAIFKSRAALQFENLALRHPLTALQRSVKRPKLTAADRFFWTRLLELWSDWRTALIIVKPQTVIAWHRKGFRLFWTWEIRYGQAGRPSIPKDVRELIRNMSRDKRVVGCSAHPRRTTQVRHRHRRDQRWQVRDESPETTVTDLMVSVDFFTVPTIRFQVLYVSLVPAHPPKADRVFQRHRSSHGGMDCPATAGVLPL
jgi:hypothetical protein